MKVGIIGAGASGIYCALLIKKKHPDWDVSIFEKEQKVGRKLLATGNGHCNVLNEKIVPSLFNNKKAISYYLNLYPFDKLLDTIHSLGILTMKNDEYIYPLTYSAASFVHVLENQLKKLSIQLFLGTKVMEYKKSKQNITVITDKGDFCVDYLLICCGGKSSPNLGSDGSLFSILMNHGYHVSPLRPGLCPIVVKEKRYLKSLSGIRHVCCVSLLKNGKNLIREHGEVLFKSDGLSGICIFNLESVILRSLTNEKFEIVLDLFPNECLEKELFLSYSILGDSFLDSILPKELQKETIRQFGKNISSQDDLIPFERLLHSLHYEFESSYSFQNSQVTIGGVSLNDVSRSLMSRTEKNVYLLGEVLDIDGLCGGNNLSWALLSALAVTDSL